MNLGLISPKGTIFSNTHREITAFIDEAYRGSADFVREVERAHSHRLHSFSSALPVIAALTPDASQIRIVDENFEEIDFEDPFDVVGVTAMTQQATRAYQIAAEFRRRGVYVAIGGIHATVLPEEAKAHADTVFVGEAENTWPRFVQDFRAGHPKPLYREDGTTDLRRSPIPRYDLMRKEYYTTVYIQTTRGCPHNCEFCASSTVYGSTYRRKTVEQVVREVVRAKEIWGDPMIYFADDNFMANRGFAKKLVEELVSLKIQWFASTDVTIAEDEGLLRRMYDSGCLFLFIGFESVSEAGLDAIDRHNWKLKQLWNYPQAIERIQANGIVVLGSFIVGLDSDDLSVFDTLERFIRDNHVYRFHISVLTPYPGTRLRARLAQEGRLLDTPWANYTMWDVNFRPKRMRPEELEAGHKRLLMRLYRPEMLERERAHFRAVYRALYRLRRRADSDHVLGKAS